jgi:hypothetical protein
MRIVLVVVHNEDALAAQAMPVKTTRALSGSMAAIRFLLFAMLHEA